VHTIGEVIGRPLRTKVRRSAPSFRAEVKRPVPDGLGLPGGGGAPS